MDSASTVPRRASGSILRAILIGGLACGVCDYLFAYFYYKKATLTGIGRSVARGVLGTQPSSLDPNFVAALGVALHFIISLGAATVFVLASRKFPVLVRYAVPAGLGYGAVVYFVMTWVVVPASAITVANYPPAVDWGALVGHLFVVGLPIALAARWFDPRAVAA